MADLGRWREERRGKRVGERGGSLGFGRREARSCAAAEAAAAAMVNDDRAGEGGFALFLYLFIYLLNYSF